MSDCTEPHTPDLDDKRGGEGQKRMRKEGSA
jgi:hypothetical protein